MAIEREMWLAMIQEGMIPETSFLSRSVDLSAFVDNNILHVAEAGVDPKVLKNNTTYPVKAAVRTDTDHELPLNTFDTENTIVRNVEMHELSYDKMQSVVRQHRVALTKEIAKDAAWSWCPSTNGAFTPVIATTGAANASALKRASFEDFLQMEAKFRALDVDLSTLTVVLNPIHLADLQAEDLKLYKMVLDSGKMFNMSLYTYSQLPYFDTATKGKVAYGTAVAAGHTQASLVYASSEVGLALGSAEVFYKEKDTDQRGDVIGFQQRAMALPLRGKYIGAVYSGK